MIFKRRTPCKECPRYEGLEILKYLGPGFLVTVGFIDPGNWASNIAAGSQYGYVLLWMVTLSTLMLIALQHNAAHLGIVTGLCLSEGSRKFFRGWMGAGFLLTAMAASVSTALAEILGGAIGLKMLFHIPLNAGAVLVTLFSLSMLLTNSYRKMERWIIAFVSVIGLSFVYELTLVDMSWAQAGTGWIKPEFPPGAMPVIMSVLGAVVMPHNLFLHSEIIQSRQWNVQGEDVIHSKLKYEFVDTLTAMAVGWVINSAMILMAAAVFFKSGTVVTELPQAQSTLRPLLGDAAAVVFALALLLAGLSSSVTAAMAGGSIFAGIFHEPLDLTDKHSRMGVFITMAGGLLVVFFLEDPFKGLIWSQIVLSIQLPLTVFALIYLTSSKKVMGKFANAVFNKIVLFTIAAIVSILNVVLFLSMV